MSEILRMDDINLPNDRKHIVKGPFLVFPLSSKNTSVLRNKFNLVMNELALLSSQFKIKDDLLNSIQFKTVEGSNKISEYISESTSLEFEDTDAKVNLIRYLDKYLFNDEQINILHPFLYNFVGLDKQSTVVVKNYAEFIFDIFFRDDELSEIFKSATPSHILLKLVLSELEKLIVEKETSAQIKYSNLMPILTNQFKEDMNFIIKYPDFFLNNFELLIQFYSFMYNLQCSIKLDQYTKANFDEITPLYFSLETEPITKKRKAIQAINSYKFIKERSENLFAHQYTLYLISHNKFNSTGQVFTYPELLKSCIKNNINEEKLVEDLTELIWFYSDWYNSNTIPKSYKMTVDELFDQLFNLVKNNMSSDVRKKFGNSLDDLGAGVFLKSRGNLGYSLNLSHDFLMLIISLIVKNERVSFNTLISEFENRGIAIDRYTREEIISLLDTHNLLDKKSDSGDVLYVKPIL